MTTTTVVTQQDYDVVLTSNEAIEDGKGMKRMEVDSPAETEVHKSFLARFSIHIGTAFGLLAAAIIIFFFLRKGSNSECPTTTQYKGNKAYIAVRDTDTAQATPMRGNIGCIDLDVLAKRPTVSVARSDQDANNVYGPMEAGFSRDTPNLSCLGSTDVVGGIDTKTAFSMVQAICGSALGDTTLLDYCGGHAVPYHYHEHLFCLQDTDPASGHSLRIATMMDGHGLYGNHTSIDLNGDFVYPTDLDACRGRVGITPDSNGEEVYYYMQTEEPPFTLGCYGAKNIYPVGLNECKALYDTCGDDSTTLTLVSGTIKYDLDCPCFDINTGYNTAQ
eukprot:GSChrysophyteH2.ASY1.ANO1.226.1 assembled CDS